MEGNININFYDRNFTYMSRNVRSGENSKSGKKSPDGLQKLEWGYKRRSLQSGEVDENGESGKLRLGFGKYSNYMTKVASG